MPLEQGQKVGALNKHLPTTCLEQELRTVIIFEQN